MITSSTRPGSSRLRSTSALSTSAPKSTGCHPEKFPCRFPPGVRIASTITAEALLMNDTSFLDVAGEGRRGDSWVQAVLGLLNLLHRPAVIRFAGCGPDDVVDELDKFGRLVAREPAPAEIEQRRGV